MRLFASRERFRREAHVLSRLAHPGVATIYDDAFAWLETAVREGATGLLLLRVHRRLDPIRQDSRYWPLVERVGLLT